MHAAIDDPRWQQLKFSGADLTSEEVVHSSFVSPAPALAASSVVNPYSSSSQLSASRPDATVAHEEICSGVYRHYPDSNLSKVEAGFRGSARTLLRLVDSENKLSSCKAFDEKLKANEDSVGTISSLVGLGTAGFIVAQGGPTLTAAIALAGVTFGGMLAFRATQGVVKGMSFFYEAQSSRMNSRLQRKAHAFHKHTNSTAYPPQDTSSDYPLTVALELMSQVDRSVGETIEILRLLPDETRNPGNNMLTKAKAMTLLATSEFLQHGTQDDLDRCLKCIDALDYCARDEGQRLLAQKEAG